MITLDHATEQSINTYGRSLCHSDNTGLSSFETAAQTLVKKLYDDFQTSG